MCKPHDLMFLEMYHVTLLLSNERTEMEEIPIHFVKSSLAPVLFVLFFFGYPSRTQSMYKDHRYASSPASVGCHRHPKVIARLSQQLPFHPHFFLAHCIHEC